MKKYNFLLIIIVFLLIYEPPILSVNVFHVLGAFSWLFIIFNHKEVSKIIKINLVLRLYVILSIFWLYLILVTFVNGTPLSNTYSFLFFMIDIIPTCIMLTVYLTNKKYNVYDFLNLLLMVGTVQCILAFGSFVSPNIKEFFVSRLINYGFSERIFQLSSFRIYGFASNLTFSTPIVQSVLASISIYLSITRNWKYAFFTPLLIFTAVINARTAFVIIAIGIILILFMLIKKLNIKSALRIILITVIFLLVINTGMNFLEEDSYETYVWVAQGFEEILQFLESGPNQTEGYFSYINNTEKYILPTGFNLLFGIGDRVLHANDNGARSDIGYVNDIWLGGIIYSIGIYVFFFLVIIKIGKSNKKAEKYLSLLLLLTFFISNVKGYIFGMNNLTNLLMLIYTFITLKKDKE